MVIHCPNCGFACANNAGLSSHRRRCDKEKQGLEDEDKIRQRRVERDAVALVARAEGSGTGDMSRRSPPPQLLLPLTVHIPNFEPSNHSPGGHISDIILPPLSAGGMSTTSTPSTDNQLVSPSLSVASGIAESRSQSLYELDDIKTEYHPLSKRDTIIHHFHEYGLEDDHPQVPTVDLAEIPWAPFRTLRDFNTAAFTLDATLNNTQIDQLINLIGNASDEHGGGKLTIRDHKEMDELWEDAVYMFPKFIKETVSAKYGEETLSFDVWYRPLWDWMTALVTDSKLANSFEWDAKRLYKFNGKEWIRFYHEPATADLMWTIQTTLPEGGKPVMLILYADKTRLSTFGTVKGYPVIARIANLHIHARNGDGPGRGCMIGWLPVIEEKSAESGKPKWIALKGEVYHKAIALICQSIKPWSRSTNDANPRFLVTLSMPTVHYRTDEDMKMVYAYALSQPTIKAREAVLMEYGLRGTKNAFWSIQNSDAYLAVSFDVLHTFDGGLFGHHIFQQILKHVQSRDAKSTLDNQAAAMPRWRNFHHFAALTTITFNDGSKFEDISKILLFVAHNILTKDADPLGYLLLKCLRAYIDLRLYAGMEVHTSETIAAGEQLVIELGELLQEYSDEAEGTELEKSFNFPKAHLFEHLFADIKLKGATRNYNTKPNEKMHGELKNVYRRRTNFRDVAPQILTDNHHRQIVAQIKEQITEHALAWKYYTDKDQADIADEVSGLEASTILHIAVGSKQRQAAFTALEKEHSNDAMFHRFRIRLQDFLNNNLQARGQQYIHLDQYATITEFRLLRVHYESMVDWRQATDLLRCNPDFYNHPRYDHVIIQSDVATQLGNVIIAKLAFIFRTKFNGKTYDLALVRPLDKHVRQTKKDKDLRFTRLKPQTQKEGCFIFLQSIIRGALVVEDFDVDDEYLLIDTIDADMFLRVLGWSD
ncbi:hypothetical protein BDN71DRAFT_1496133 [Pleurotus eryngii]|uniref:Uncharacterized protein n=1 Tax=Pleurotus eryngii TaxID=5323 RepID=A0A9P5ZVC1_PLEER|nr:hypothetical protein BDN71DRAFT_1496133 [Pleurotus eryngii]